MPADIAIPAEAARTTSSTIALIVAGTGFMQILDGAIINTSLPQMARSFGVTTVDLSLGITAYMLASAAISPLATWLADRFGSRSVMAGAILTFTAASVWCGLAHGLAMFVVARVLQGLGGALMIPVGMAVVMRHASKSEIMRATATTTWPALTAPIIGPVLGGFITEAFSWRWNFFLNLPLGLLGALAVWRFLPEDRSAQRRPLDLVGLALCAGSLTCLLSGFQRSASPGAARVVAIGLMLVGLAGGVATVRHFRRHPTPLISLASLRHSSLRFVVLAPGGAMRATFAATTFLLPLLFQLGFGLSPAAAGSWVLVYFCGNLGIKPFTSAIMRRFGFRNVLLVDGLLVAASLLPFAFVTPGTPRIPLILLLLFAGAVRSTQLTALNTLAYAEVPGAERRAAANLLSMLQQASFTAGVAMGAFSLSLFQEIHASARVALPELHAAFLVGAGIGLAGALMFAGMRADMGREVSGHAG